MNEKWYLNFLVMTVYTFKEIKIFGLKTFIIERRYLYESIRKKA